MLKGTKWFVLLIVLGSCIDLITFDTANEEKRLVVDATITTLSYNDRLNLPMEAEYFSVRLAFTSDVSNLKDEPVVGAEVLLSDDMGNQWQYTDMDNDGKYVLYDPEFKVLPNRTYQLHITTETGEVYKSQTERLREAEPINALQHEFVEKEVVKEKAGNEELVTVKGVEGSVAIPLNTDSEKFYRWKLIAGWEVQADLLQGEDPNKRCWLTNRLYFDHYRLQRVLDGGYNEKLFFLDLTANSRVKHEFTVLAIQYSLNEGAYEFWELIKKQSENGGSIFDPPPFQIPSNIECVSHTDYKTSGYFVVADESVTRWFIKPADLPYALSFDDPCASIPGVPFIPPAQCSNCLDYRSGYSFISNSKPSWWY